MVTLMKSLGKSFTAVYHDHEFIHVEGTLPQPQDKSLIPLDV